jgi:Ca-activated chloride channel family protein
MLRFQVALVFLCALLVGCGRAKTATKSMSAPDTMAPAPEVVSGPEQGEFNTEAYDRIHNNPFLAVQQSPLSTFSIDVDTASYANVRRFLNQGQRPPKDAVRIEELVNYFPYAYSPPTDDKPFSSQVELAECPWNRDHYLARIALKGKEIPPQERAPLNLAFLLDVSGSMDSPNKLPLVKAAMAMLVRKLTDRDRVSIVVYAGAAGVILPATSCADQSTILAALDRLDAGGSTAGGAGIQLAYDTARRTFDPAHVNRVVLCTDGDFNVGVSDQGSLIRLIEEEARSGVFLTILGFGMGNLKDSTLQKLADSGNGNYGYVDSFDEARKLLVEQFSGTLVPIAKDVKIQIEFNPAHVAAYRLIGYEKRLLRAEDFHDDQKDAGEIGAGHTVTAFYELVPPGKEGNLPKVDALKYQPSADGSAASASNELLTLKLRYKLPQADTSELLTFPVVGPVKPLAEASPDFRFAAAVAGWGMLLRDSEHKGLATFQMVMELAQAAKGDDPFGYRAEFLRLVTTSEAVR